MSGSLITTVMTNLLESVGVYLTLLCFCPFAFICHGSELPEKIPVTTVELPEILARKYVNNKAIVPGGHYPEPYMIFKPSTEYVLDGDITADGTAIIIRAPKVILNLKGKTIIYNQTKPGEGVTVDKYHINDVAIIDGKILQGTAQSEGDVYGSGNNLIKSIGVVRMQISNINGRYGGRDVNGFHLKYVGEGIIENCTLEDIWNVGTMKNRHQGKSVILVGEKAIVRNNNIINARQSGVAAGNNSEIYDNNISVNSMVTNSAGIVGYKAKGIKAYHNTIVGRGEHPLGIAFVSAGTENIDVYNNSIDVQTTKIGDEYEAAGGNYAVGFRTTWGGNNINFHDNTITVRTDAAFKGTRSSTGASVVVNGKGRGLMVGVGAGESSKFSNNTISVLDKDGKGKAFGIACTGGNIGEMIFEGNVVTSNILNVALGDEYGACGGHPLFIRNTFVKSGNFSSYQTVTSELGGYFEGTGRFVANIYKEGASQENININAAGQGKKSVYFGRELTAQLQTNSGRDTSGAAFKLVNGGDPPDLRVNLDSDRKAKLYLYDYELHNRESKSVKTQKVTSHTIQLIDGSEIFSTKPGALSLSSEKLSSSKNHLLDLYKDDVVVPDLKVLVSF